MIYVDQLGKTKKLYTAYSGGMVKSLRRKIMGPFRKFSQARNFGESMARADTIFSFSASQAQPSKQQRKYLDIGCNKGFLLAVGIEQGWDVYGEELIPELTAPFCNSYKKYCDHIYNGRFADVRSNFQDNMFELITAIDVIEHFEDVVSDLQGIFEILNDGGTFVIQTPDVACDEANRLKSKWGALKPLEHLHLFSAENLKTLVERIGFVDYQIFDCFEEADGNFVAVMKKPKSC
ncbi:MAG: class I SAM-dependent methyltransferase [Gammaproteobacteria bacterium]|nr:class I SAM-dependent methyltransferase [Gammaproteobacteria bacterium]